MVDEKDLKMTKVTKTSVTLSVMAANGDKPMADVVALILKAQHAAGFSDVTLKICEGAYRWAVRKSVAPGVVPEKAPKAARAPKASKAKTKAQALAVVKAVKAASKSTAPTKSPEEIERIRSANMARLREVGARFQQTARKPEAEAATVDRHDPFAAPAFLTKDELKALV